MSTAKTKESGKRIVEHDAKYTSEDKRTMDITCPFCGTETMSYTWSIHGVGKRCSEKTCAAIHYGSGMSIIED